MNEAPLTPDEPEIPEEPPAGPEGGEAAIPDAPMGIPADADPDEEAQPGIPEREPPASG